MYQENAYLCTALRYYNDGIKICKTILQGMYQDIELLGFAFIAPKYPHNSSFYSMILKMHRSMQKQNIYILIE